MNANAAIDDPVIEYYDSDYPSRTNNPQPENFDDVTGFQGVRDDVTRYQEIASELSGDVLELCCGTGRIAFPLAKQGHTVTAVDVSAGMLARFRANFKHWEPDVSERINLVEADISDLDLDRKNFTLCIIGFNSLMCLTDFGLQRKALRRVADHLAPDGQLVLDVLNPLQLTLKGSSIPKPFFTRTNPLTNHRYTRFAMSDPIDANRCQRLHGWYDEVSSDNVIRRSNYSMVWRPIFRFELQFMLEEAGFELMSVHGDHRNAPFSADSAHMFTRAIKRGHCDDKAKLMSRPNEHPDSGFQLNARLI